MTTNIANKRRINTMKKLQKSRSNNTGMVLLDVLIALSLAAVFSSLLASMSILSRNLIEKGKNKSIAIAEYIQASTTSDFTAKSTSTLYGNDYIENIISIKEKGIEENLSTSSIIDFYNIRAIDVNGNQNKHQNEELYLDLFDFKSEPICTIDFDKTSTLGSYTHTQKKKDNRFSLDYPIIDKINLPLSNNQTITAFEIRNNVLFISTDSVTASDPDFYIIDITDRVKPIIKAQLNTGPGLSDFVLVGKYIFASARSIAYQLHTLYRPQGFTLELVDRYRLMTPNASTSPPYTSTIAYKDKKLFIGTEKWAGSEFVILDISDLNNKIETGYLDINNKINHISLFGDKAYISSAGEGQFRRVNIVDTANPYIEETFSPSGWNRQEGKISSIFEDQMVFARTNGGFNIVNDKEIFSWPAINTLDFDQSKNLDIPGGVYGIIQDRYHIYSVSRRENNEIIIFDRDEDQFVSPLIVHIADQPHSMSCDGRNIYVLAYNKPVLYVLSFD